MLLSYAQQLHTVCWWFAAGCDAMCRQDDHSGNVGWEGSAHRRFCIRQWPGRTRQLGGRACIARLLPPAGSPVRAAHSARAPLAVCAPEGVRVCSTADDDVAPAPKCPLQGLTPHLALSSAGKAGLCIDASRAGYVLVALARVFAPGCLTLRTVEKMISTEYTYSALKPSRSSSDIQIQVQ